MKTKHGYITLSNGYINWYIKEAFAQAACEAFVDQDLESVSLFSCMSLDTESGSCIDSDWPAQVRDLTSLKKKLK